ncbi:MAG: hydroxymethylglutaryl-CoA synthase family protein [Chloroflexi bacterium]|nr:hydroxymethylglutaryl-CoA synthase family protein [Chloroflexota bacterium]
MEGNSLAGIAAYGAYVPKYRLGGETLGWNSDQERAVANFDEDSVTMAVAAGRDCLRGLDRGEIDGLIFASTTPAYAEKQCAAIVATALDLRRDLFTADITNVLRAGTAGLRSALDAVVSGSAQRVLVIASDHRQGAPRGDIERNSGDGAAALLVANHAVIAQWEGSHSITENMLDSWRSAGDPFVQSWEERFATEEGLERLVGETVQGFFQKQAIAPADVAKVALYAPDARRHAQLARKLGFHAEQVQDPLFGRLGNTGAAFPLMLLTQALADAGPEQLLMLVSYGDGSDVLAFRTTPSAGRPPQKGLGLKGHLESKRVLESYELYARWRGVWPTDDAARRPAPASPSVTALWREEEKNLRFHGEKCNSCGYIQYPPQRVCVNCQSRDDASPVPLSERPGTVFTYSMDYIAGTTDTPLVIAVVDFEGGGRVLCMLTDREVDEVSVGMPVEMSFRKLRVVNGIHNYYWKAVPRRF